MRLSSFFALAAAAAAVSPFVACVDDTATGNAPTVDASVPVSDAGPPDVVTGSHDSGPLADASTESDAVADAVVAADVVVEASDAEADAEDGADAPLDAADASPGADASDAGGGVALLFDGIDDIVELPTAAGGANETAFTAEVWFKTTSATGNFFEVYGGGGADRFLFLDGGQACFYVFAAPTTKICSKAATYADGAWHHVAGTLGAVSGTRLYVDGALSASSATPTSSAFNYDTNFRLGYGHTDVNSAFVRFAGELDEVRVWNVERSAAEIVASYRAHLAGTTPGLQGYWPLDESAASMNAHDATANGHDGTLNGFTFTPSPWVGPGAF